ncbi:MAG: hypothetical protein R3321_00395 [Nitrososphaeraceae archaeon]|nr:hypothetical protein [Nitrososphaeraceae archaeon]
MDNLTLAQQFELKRIRDAAPNLSREQKLNLIIQAQRLKYIKETFTENGFDIISAMNFSLEKLFNLQAMEERLQKNTNDELTDLLTQYIEDLMTLDSKLRKVLKNEILGE